MVSSLIIFVPLNPSVRPEELATTNEGASFLNTVRDVTAGYGRVFWGRGVDKTEVIAVIVDITGNDEDDLPLEKFNPFASQPAWKVRVDIDPTRVPQNPVTEIAILPLDEQLSDRHLEQATRDAQSFAGTILPLENPTLRVGKLALAYQFAFADGPPRNRIVMMLGWNKVQDHWDTAATDAFKTALKPISDLMVGELWVTHFNFQSL